MKSGTAIEEVLNHLMFHKAIIHEGERSDRLDRYLEILRSMEDDGFSSRDPFDRSIEMVFSLVLNNDMDPWDIDLMEFSRLYAERMENKEVDFIVAGKLLFMAWYILRCQSERVLRSQEMSDTEKPFFAEWEADSLDLFFDDGESEQLLTGFDFGDPPLQEAVRHRTRRPVMLVELLDAFDAARREARINLRKKEIKKENEEFDEKAHPERLEKDIDEVWNRIQKFGGGPIALEDLCNGDKDDLITVFVSLLFLTRMGKIALWQDDLPDGQIFLEVKIPWDIGTIEDAEKLEAEVIRGETVM